MPTANVFPALSSGNLCKYPVKRTHNQRAKVHRFCDLTEQRNNKGLPLTELELEYQHLKTADKELLRAFWDFNVGSAGHSWSWTFDGVTYPKCQFTGTFKPQLEGPGTWSLTLNFRSLGVPTT